MEKHLDTKEYFFDLVKQSDLDLSDDTEFYVVDLLSNPMQLDQELIGFEKPVVFIYKEADEGDISKFKDLGDSTLINLIVFEDKLEQKPVDKDYYMHFGKIGYKKFRNLVDYTKDSVFSKIYTELSKKFENIVNSISP
jgi:hypothetical protein